MTNFYRAGGGMAPLAPSGSANGQRRIKKELDSCWNSSTMFILFNCLKFIS